MKTKNASNADNAGDENDENNIATPVITTSSKNISSEATQTVKKKSLPPDSMSNRGKIATRLCSPR